MGLWLWRLERLTIHLTRLAQTVPEHCRDIAGRDLPTLPAEGRSGGLSWWHVPRRRGRGRLPRLRRPSGQRAGCERLGRRWLANRLTLRGLSGRGTPLRGRG